MHLTSHEILMEEGKGERTGAGRRSMGGSDPLSVVIGRTAKIKMPQLWLPRYCAVKVTEKSVISAERVHF